MFSDCTARGYAHAYVWGYPTVDVHGIICAQVLDPESPEFKAPFNELKHARELVTPADRSIVAMNVDTPYSYLWMDLRAEPLVVTVPAFEAGRYVAMQILDLYTYIVGYVSPRTNGNAGGDFLITGPGWSGIVPDGISDVFDAPTDIAFALFRTQLFGPDDLDSVHRIQDGYRVRPLSAYLGLPAPPRPAPFVEIAPADARDDTGSLQFFRVLNAMLAYMPPLPEEVQLREHLAECGIAAGAEFPDAGHRAQVAREGMERGLEELSARARRVRSSAELFGSRSFLGADYVSRAVGAMLGIFGNAQEEYLGVGYQSDVNGAAFSGDQRYEIRFEPGSLPPVHAFWSLTAYGADRFLYANEIDRYVINTPMVPSLVRGEDGSITIYVQHERPVEDKVANWLPVPAGDFGLTMRAYQPEQAIIDGEWTAPPVVPVC